MGRVVPLPSRLEGLGDRRKLPQRGPGKAPADRKRVLEYLELEKAHLIATSLSHLTFLWHIFSNTNIHNYYT